MTFEEFAQTRMHSLGKFAGALVGDRHLAEDVLSEALLKVAVRWGRISGMVDPDAYVRRVVVRTYLDDRRKAARRGTEPTSDTDVLDRGGTEAQDAVVSRDEVDRLVAVLLPHQRSAIVLRYLCDQTDDQIAEVLGCSAATVRSHLSKARATLRLRVDRVRTEQGDQR